jgi:hypothetical protein
LYRKKGVKTIILNQNQSKTIKNRMKEGDFAVNLLGKIRNTEKKKI